MGGGSINWNGRDEDSITYASSISTASMGLGGSVPRPEEGRGQIHIRGQRKVQVVQCMMGSDQWSSHFGLRH